jgi:hypothetical protein
MAENEITAVSVKGFKSFAEEQRIEIRPLTILAGANSSGKSSALQPLLLLKQTLEAPYDPGPLLLDGPHVQFTSAKQLLTRLSSHSPTHGFFVAVEMSSGRSIASEFRQIDAKFDLIRTVLSDSGAELVLTPEMTNEVPPQTDEL